MKEGFTQSMAFLHSWAGLLFGGVLFSIFFCGSLSVFRPEIDIWATPQLQGRGELNRAAALARGLSLLEQEAPESRQWRISLPSEREPVLQVSWQDDNGATRTRRVAPHNGEAVLATEGGRLFARYHHRLSIDDGRTSRVGRWLIGVLGFAMLVILVSGVFIHRRLWRDLFVFRPASSRQRSWTDVHNVMSVLALPFHLVIVCTGFAVNYWIYMPAAIDTLYQGDWRTYRADVGQGAGNDMRLADVPGAPSDNLAFAALMQRAEAVLGQDGVSSITLLDRGRETAVAEFRGRRDDRIAQQMDRVVLSGVTGEVLTEVTSRPPLFATQSVMVGIHYVLFGGAPMRWLYFSCGLAGAGMIATGTLLFVHKRRATARSVPERRLLTIAEHVNVIAMAGLPLASIVYMWGLRLLPQPLADRPHWEISVFFYTWLLSGLYATLRPVARAWIELLTATSLLCLALPASGWLLPGSDLPTTLRQGDLATAGVDLVTFAAGLGLALFTAYLIRRRDTVLVLGKLAPRPG
ncbi:MAG TPA: PepSY-associated TM helix domain-containing protein [Hyphomicrobiales bacterium]|nr:PepSY-associated TM helix domain-containing protein [Hyphomicrobiales bacterium]